MSSRHPSFIHAQTLCASLAQPDEHIMGYWMAEESDFIRFTQGAVRQPGHVSQIELRLTLTAHERQASLDLTLSGYPPTDQDKISETLQRLRGILPHLDADPHCVRSPQRSTEDLSTEPPPLSKGSSDASLTSTQVLNQFLTLATPLDVVGILASGWVSRGVFDSEGMTRWHQRPLQHLDWSVVHSEDKAVKCSWGGPIWSIEAIARRLDEARAILPILGRPAYTPPPGMLRALLSPTAVSSFIQMLAMWGGWSEAAFREHRSPLEGLRADRRQLSPLLTISESTAGASAPFQEHGHKRIDHHMLVGRGRWGSPLVSPSSALKYSASHEPISHTAAMESESPQSLEISAGTLAQEESFEALGDGAYLSNVWYLNFSDRANARVTGTSRFASLWVEGGVPVAPLAVMRFDDCLYDVFGGRLEVLSSARELLPSASTYGRRSLSSCLAPSALCSGLRFTL